MATATKTFEYSVRDRKGKLVSGKLEAPTEAALVPKLRGMGYAPVVGAGGQPGLNSEIKLPGSGRVEAEGPGGHVSRQFATMINSGLSLLRALSILSEQTENAALARTLGEVRNDVESRAVAVDRAGQAPQGLPAADDQHVPGR